MRNGDSKKPLVDPISIRLDEDLSDRIEAEARRREQQPGVEINRSKLVRYLIRVGLETIRDDDGDRSKSA